MELADGCPAVAGNEASSFPESDIARLGTEREGRGSGPYRRTADEWRPGHRDPGQDSSWSLQTPIPNSRDKAVRLAVERPNYFQTDMEAP